MPATRRLAILVVMVAAGMSTAFARPAAPRYVEPTAVDDHVFPVARSNWYSVINFSNDWHQPRMRLIDGVWKQVGVHEGTDIFAEPGTPVLAALGGRVENLGWLFYSGWRVGIRGDDDRYWFYAHLLERPALQLGQRVEAGDQIGEVGNTGYGERPGHKDEFTYHLHFGIQAPDGTWHNPYPLLERLYRAAVRA